MQRELGQILGDQCDQPGIMRARRNFAEPHAVALHEQFHAEDAAAADDDGDENVVPIGDAAEKPKKTAKKSSSKAKVPAEGTSEAMAEEILQASA